jgi:hypothetical protein
MSHGFLKYPIPWVECSYIYLIYETACYEVGACNKFQKILGRRRVWVFEKNALAVIHAYTLSNDRIIPGLDSNAHPSLVHSYFE